MLGIFVNFFYCINMLNISVLIFLGLFRCGLFPFSGFVEFSEVHLNGNFVLNDARVQLFFSVLLNVRHKHNEIERLLNHNCFTHVEK